MARIRYLVTLIPVIYPALFDFLFFFYRCQLEIPRLWKLTWIEDYKNRQRLVIFSNFFKIRLFLTFFHFSCMFLNPNIFSNWNSDCSNFLVMRNLQEQVKKAFCYQKLFWTFTVWINCSSDLKIFANSRL